MSLIRMENLNLKSQNQVLAMKNETLEKEKKHYKNATEKKQQEIDQLNEQLLSLQNQIEQLKVQIRLSNHSQENSLVQRPFAQTLLSSQNLSSSETPKHQMNNKNSNPRTSPLTYIQISAQNTAIQQNFTSQIMVQHQPCISTSNSNVIFKKQPPQVHQSISNCQNNQLQQQQIISQQAETLQTKQQQRNLVQQNEDIYNQINTQSPGKDNNYLNQCEDKHHNGLSPIVNSEERSEFVSNSILEEIRTTNSQIQTINNSLIIQNSNARVDSDSQQSDRFIPQNRKISNKL